MCVRSWARKTSLLPEPDEEVMEWLTDERQALKLLAMPTNHFPMLAANAQFVRLLKEFLEAPDVSALEMKEEWRRRKR
ncbi:MAG: hypothetical protein HC915_17375, partial [Anaerolineae bacterium]|nr:hypothetical protein [Anaerolineae bacterium]